MINTDYKIVTSLINNRLLQPSLQSLGPHQTGFLPGRHILDTVKEAQILLERANATRTPIYMVLLDQEKAYDRVDRPMLYKILQKVGIPTSMIEAIKTCLKGATSRISVNKHLTEPIPLERGVRQGDPLSCLLFDFVIETLAKLVLATKDLPGVTDALGRVHKVGLFADDFRVSLTHPRQWKAFRRCYDIYSGATQAKMADQKTIILYAGTDDPPEKIGDVKLTNSGVAAVYLGIPIGNQIDQTEIFVAIQKKIMAKIERYRYIYISLRGRIKIAKMVMYSKLWYFLRCLPISQTQVKDLEGMIERYIWVREPNEKLRRSLKATQAIKPIRDGGLNAMDLNTMRLSLNIFWVARMKHFWVKDNPDLTPGWVPLAIETILTAGENTLWSQGKFRAQLKFPWAQRWLRSEHLTTPSVHYWWRPWVENNREAGHRHHMIPPTTAEEVKSVYFWFHPVLWRGENSVKWGSKVWIELSEGRYGPVPNTISDLAFLQRRESQYAMREVTNTEKVATLQRAINHLLNLLPEDWKNLWNWDSEPRPTEIFRGQYFDGSVVWAKSNKVLPLNSSNKNIYRLLLENQMDPEPLHNKLWDLGEYNEPHLDILKEEPERIWLMVDHKKLYYPKVTDLLWRILTGTCNAGKAWADPRDCPICRTRQTPEHLFWDCPAAKAVWAMHKTVWQRATEEEYPGCNSYTEMMLDGTVEVKDTDNHRRRRILYSEALWAIWLLQTEWSREGTCDFTTAAAVERFKQRVQLRIKVDRLLALGYGATTISPDSYQRVWGLDVNQDIETTLVQTQ